MATLNSQVASAAVGSLIFWDWPTFTASSRQLVQPIYAARLPRRAARMRCLCREGQDRVASPDALGVTTRTKCLCLLLPPFSGLLPVEARLVHHLTGDGAQGTSDGAQGWCGVRSARDRVRMPGPCIVRSAITGRRSRDRAALGTPHLEQNPVCRLRRRRQISRVFSGCDSMVHTVASSSSSFLRSACCFSGVLLAETSD